MHACVRINTCSCYASLVYALIPAHVLSGLLKDMSMAPKTPAPPDEEFEAMRLYVKEFEGQLSELHKFLERLVCVHVCLCVCMYMCVYVCTQGIRGPVV